MANQVTGNASDFLDSIGVCAHLDQTETSYGNQTLVRNELMFLGTKNVRVTAPAISGSNLPAYQALGQMGIKFDVISSDTDLGKQIGLLNSIAPYVRSVEGPNEVDSNPVAYNGLTGTGAAIAYQRDFYSAVHHDPSLNGVSVLPFSLSQSSNSGAYGNLSSSADYGNIHTYAQNGVPPYYFLPFNIANTTDTPGLPPIITETGNYTFLDGTSGVSQGVQAKWMVDTFLDNYKNGVARTFTYQLMDPVNNPSSANPEDHWGEFNADGSPKLSAIALHNLTTILADPGTPSGNAAVSATLSGLPAIGGFSTTLQKSNGNIDVALWQEPVFWNSAASSENPVTPSTVTVYFGQAVSSVQVYDVMTGTAPIATYSGVSTIAVPLGTDPLIVEVTPATPNSLASAAPQPVTLGTGPNSIGVGISEDAWLGDAQFTLSVDGSQVGGMQTATVSHASGTSKQYTVAGTFAPGAHTVTVNFLNDAYGGTPSADRNLYVDSVTAGGTVIPENAALFSSGAKDFGVVLPNTATTPGLAQANVATASGVSITSTTVNAGTTAPAFIPAPGTVALDGGTTGGQTLSGSGARTDFILHAGSANGDVITNFNPDPASGDVLTFAGYGVGATLRQADASHWVASSVSGLVHDVVGFAGGVVFDPALAKFV